MVIFPTILWRIDCRRGVSARRGGAWEISDLLLDWQGGRTFNEGFDQILHETDAGREFREALFAEMESSDGLDAPSRLAVRLPDIAGRGESWAIFTLDTEAGTVRFGDGLEGSIPATGSSNLAAVYRAGNGGRGEWLVTRPSTNLVFECNLSNAVTSATLALALVDTNGTAKLMRWLLTNLPAGACVHFDGRANSANPTNQGSASPILLIDTNCNGTMDAFLSGTVTTINELPPTVISAVQDPTVQAGRPAKPCVPAVPGYPNNYGTVLAVLFSKPMIQETVNVPSAYSLENGNTAGSVQIQPGGRVALLNIHLPVGAIVPRTMTVSGVTDPRGHLATNAARAVETDLFAGVAIRGRVVRADSSPAARIPVTLTMYDSVVSFECESFIVRVSQVLTDDGGYFDFDFVMSGIPYSVSATDTGGLPSEAISLLLESANADRIQSDRLVALASSASAQNTLLGAFAVGTLAEAVARAESLDRALLRDFVPVGSAREGTTVPVALRFRGRGVVTGRVVASDGITPAPNTAVNLFPDPDSRELGRGIFSDSAGRFGFLGVPLGAFTVQAQSPTGLFRTISGTIDQVGQTNEVLIVLSSNIVVWTELMGRVTEADGVTPHGRAQVLVGRYDEEGRFGSVVALATADADGFWLATSVPVGLHDVIAISIDGKRKGERRDILAVTGSAAQVNLVLQGRVTVAGRVETATGLPVSSAIVAGGEELVRTDVNGRFTLSGVPTGQRTISVGVERSPPNEPAKSNPPFDFPRFGSASLNVLSGANNFTVVRLDPAGRIIGRVLDGAGNPVPHVQVAIPENGGFSWVAADEQGNYRFENLALNKYELSAPAPGTANTDTSGLVARIRNSESEDQVQAAIGEAFAIFTGAADPFLNGQGATFNPLTWGFTATTLAFDGHTAVADIRYLRQGTIAGKVINGQGVPIGARVDLEQGTYPRDHFQGTNDLKGQIAFLNVFEGSYAVSAQFVTGPTTVSGRAAASVSRNQTNTVLVRLAPTARIRGTFVMRDLITPVQFAQVAVGNLGFTTTGTNGFFEVGGLPLGTYRLVSQDPVTGIGSTLTVTLVFDGEVRDVQLVEQARGEIKGAVVNSYVNGHVPGANVTVHFADGLTPNRTVTTGPDGRFSFPGSPAGGFDLQAEDPITQLHGSNSGTLGEKMVSIDINVPLQPLATLAGIVLLPNGVTPATNATVKLAGGDSPATADTDSAGRVSFVDLKLLCSIRHQ